jgi:Ser/Thr protein kinase RdoA (MazF antagonist)
MSVFTPVGRDELAEFLCNFPACGLQGHEGTSERIGNTSYFVTTNRCEMVLTLFETHTFEEMGYFHDLMARMAEHGVHGAHPAAVLGAALRFWLSRLHGWHFPRPGEITHRKDPNAFRRIMGMRQKRTGPLPLAG